MTHIPGTTRVSSGPLKIGDDWTGIFIRGDETNDWIGTLRLCAYLLKQYPSLERDLFDRIDILNSCTERRS